jgi:hypothetical protein
MPLSRISTAHTLGAAGQHTGSDLCVRSEVMTKAETTSNSFQP